MELSECSMRLPRKKIILSFIPCRWGGAGDYLAEIIAQNTFSYVLVPRTFSHNKKTLNRILVQLQIPFLLIWCLLLLLIFSSAQLTLFHPQTMTYRLSALLLSLAGSIRLYILDAHFFCMKSYNQMNGKECLKCLNFHQPETVCRPFPRKDNLKNYIKYKDLLKYRAHEIEFIVQTHGYKDLVKSSIAIDAKISIEPMITPVIKKLQNYSPTHNKPIYDIAYHAAFLQAKGSDYFISLVKKAPSIKFFVPASPSVIEINLPNLDAQDFSWDTGLQEVLEVSKIVVCPSVWSAPIEAAVLKSMLLVKPVAIMKSNTMCQLIPSAGYISLSGNVLEDSIMLKDMLQNPQKLKLVAENGMNWAKEYICRGSH